MSVREALDKLLESLPEQQQREVLDLRRFFEQPGRAGGVAPIRPVPTRSRLRAE